jgi:hypothetical protein
MPTPLSLRMRNVSGIPTFPMPSSRTKKRLINIHQLKTISRGVYDVQSFTKCIYSPQFGERALTIILNQNSDFATALNSNWLQNDKSQRTF